ncbi:MAG: DUF1848 domain-containing protein [Muribaculaceae bacterium]
MRFKCGFSRPQKIRGDSQACGCILSKEVGRYNTCTHGCLYCYATNTPAPAKLKL